MSMHIRSMCIKTLEDFIAYMRTYVVSIHASAALSLSLFPIIVRNVEHKDLRLFYFFIKHIIQK